VTFAYCIVTNVVALKVE